MATLSPSALGLEHGSPEAVTLQQFLGRGEWRVQQLADALGSLRCLEVPEPEPHSPGGPLVGLARALQCSRAEEADSGVLANLDDAVLQARLQFRMAQAKGSEGQELGADIDYILALVQDLASRLREERRAHALELEQLRQEVNARAQRRSRLPAGEGAPAAPDAATGAKAGRGGNGQDRIQAIRRAQEERRAALADAVARLQKEQEETRARERTLAEEKETLIKGEALPEPEGDLGSPCKGSRRSTSTASPGSLASSPESLAGTSPEAGSQEAAFAYKRSPFLMQRAGTCPALRAERARRGRRLLRGNGGTRGPFILQVRQAMGEMCEEESGETEAEAGATEE
mmetsp:Transcript_14343/g.45128  ORF Transcript_14343/g.45128 Transcript_14343/m.45128 type:complete len:344 (+) Transcript_14343:59-1090(+)